jgi:YD repeat-containing protein
LRRFLIALVGCCLGMTGLVFAGPIWTGAVLFLLPPVTASADHAAHGAYVPRHKGNVDLATGLYIREDEDLVLEGTPPLVLRRTYLSGYRASREFGIGTTHNGEWYLIGDAGQFQWAALVLATGTRIRFDRVSPGTTVLNAMFEHRSSPTEFHGARLGWTGFNWALRLPDGWTYTFRGCGGEGSLCSVTEARDGDGHRIEYQRDRSGRLLKIASDDRWIAFDYDDQRRIARAFASTQQEVWYAYDDRGRLIRVRSTDGSLRRYTYTPLDEMETIEDPEIRIRNTYASGRVVRQINLFPDDAEPLIWEFSYTLHGDTVVAAETTRSDGGWKRMTFDRGGYVVAESTRLAGTPRPAFSYTRDPVSNAITTATVECIDRRGQLARHSSIVRPGELARIEDDLVLTHCRAFPPRQ